MANIWVGSASAGAADGSSWANRYDTLTAAEDKPVAAGDTVYVGAGAYRELLTVDVSGSSGAPITYVADLTGEHTDGIGGIVRLTGTSNDRSAASANCIVATSASRTYRTFRGFSFDTTTSHLISVTDATNWIIEDCIFQPPAGNFNAIAVSGSAQAAITIRRCKNFSVRASIVQFTHTATVNNAGHLVENCENVGSFAGVRIDRVGGITVKNNTFLGAAHGVRVLTAITVGQTVTVNNNTFVACTSGALQGTVSGEIIEDYNTFFANGADRTNVATGANSVTYPPLFLPPLLLANYKFPWWFGELSEWSQVRRIAGSNMSTDDLFGMPRPTTDAKKSWGATQFNDVSRETTTIRSGCAALKLADAGRKQFIIPTGASSLTVSVYVNRTASYAGTACPQMVIYQPGQSSSTYTDTGAASAWNQLTSGAFTPSGSPSFIVVELVSDNSASSGSTFWDDLSVA